MTAITKPTKRETLSAFQGRALIIELHPTHVVLRQKGKRFRYTATYDQLWKLGAMNAAEERRREKAAAKKAKGANHGGR